jgi:hypothetical protein
MNYASIAMAMASGLRGRSFVLVMEHDQGWNSQVPYDAYRNNPDVSFHPRESQPCWGELRKYTKNYPEECTQPENNKPTDLWHKFPEGRPLGLAVDFSVNTLNSGLEDGNQTTNRVLEKLFDKKHSIYPQMIGDVQFQYNAKKNIIGFYMSNLEIDPTVLVHYLRKSYLYFGESANAIKTYVDSGLTWREAFTIHYLNSGNPIWNGCTGGYSGFQYNIRRLLQGTPRDLSGGSLRDRVDYNRTSIDELFCYDPGEEKEIKWDVLCAKLGIHKGGSLTPQPMSIKPVCDRFKEAFEDILKGGQTKRKLFVWKGASKTLAAKQKVLKVA